MSAESSTQTSRFRMPNIWKPFIFIFTSQDLSSRPCVYGWPVLTLPPSANSTVKTWLCCRKQLLASPPLNPEASSAVWSGHQALWFNYDYQLIARTASLASTREKKCQRYTMVWTPMWGHTYVLHHAKIMSIHELRQGNHSLMIWTLFSSPAQRRSP